ncbi:MAG TPA: right-handed parallel beta-helix repeat-containing protein [Prolixibacteraceae bacterium]|nr:right-handed parallel beta-helix repeat-containing protein [Prolixibacteraceae bacterium]
MKRIISIALLTLCFQWAYSTVYEVSTLGNDVTGNGSVESPWRTIKYAVTKVPAGQGHSIHLSEGTFEENGQINILTGVNVEGSGIDKTIIKAAASFYYHPASPGYTPNKFLINLSSTTATNGNQSLKNFTLDGDNKQVHGGIYVKGRSNVLLEKVNILRTNFCGIWLWEVKSSAVKDVKLVNCAWGSTAWASGALMLAYLENVEVDGLNVDENDGYGIKTLGSGANKVKYLKIHDSHISVNPNGKWNNGSAPNIAIELWDVALQGCEIFNTYVDNHISLVSSEGAPALMQSIRVYNNIIDLLTRAKGHGYGIELSMSNVEIDHNYIAGGMYGIAHWSAAIISNWQIHHNTFYGLSSFYPGDIIRAQVSGIHNVKLFNNTIEFTGTKTIHFIGLHGGKSDHVEVKNNLIINSNMGYSYGVNQLVFMENGATISDLQVASNLLDKMPLGKVTGGVYENNILEGAQIKKTGDRPIPYYIPADGSSLINTGMDVGFPFQGSAPDIGAYESVITASLEGQKIIKTMYSFPNPIKSGDVLHINVPHETGNLSLLDMRGVTQRMVKVKDNSIQIPTAGLLEGMYLLHYQSLKGSDVSKIRID